MKFPDISYLYSPEFWKSITGNDFNRGFIAAASFILALLLILVFLRALIYLIFFRSRRTNAVVVKRQDGDTMITKEVIAGTVRAELAAYPAVKMVKLAVLRRNNEYMMNIHCEYLLSDQAGFPAFCDEFKPKLIAALKNNFGIENLKKIRFWVSSAEDNDAGIGALTGENSGSHYIGI